MHIHTWQGQDHLQVLHITETMYEFNESTIFHDQLTVCEKDGFQGSRPTPSMLDTSISQTNTRPQHVECRLGRHHTTTLGGKGVEGPIFHHGMGITMSHMDLSEPEFEMKERNSFSSHFQFQGGECIVNDNSEGDDGGKEACKFAASRPEVDSQ